MVDVIGRNSLIPHTSILTWDEGVQRQGGFWSLEEEADCLSDSQRGQVGNATQESVPDLSGLGMHQTAGSVGEQLISQLPSAAPTALSGPRTSP